MSGDFDSLDKMIAVVLVTGAVTLLPGGWFMYKLYTETEKTKAAKEELSQELQSTQTDLSESRSEFEKMQKELEQVQDELEQARSNLGITQEELDNATKTVEERDQDLEEQKENVKILATCLSGVAQALALLGQDDAEALIMLGRVESYCNESSQIIDSLSSSGSPDFRLLPS